jgi:hypothetical protein
MTKRARQVALSFLFLPLSAGCAPTQGSAEISAVGAASDSTDPAAASDLWISVLSVPNDEDPNAQMLGAYVHCPVAGRARVDLYEIGWSDRRLVRAFDTVATADRDRDAQGAGGVPDRLTLAADRAEDLGFRIAIGPRNEGSLAPFQYKVGLTVDPSIFTPTAAQLMLSALIENPAYPQYTWQPVWQADLTACHL